MSSYSDDLDAALKENGEDAVLRRDGIDVTVRVNVRRAGVSEQLAVDVLQDMKKVIMSMTQILAAGWPGTTTTGSAPFVIDTRIPVRGDELIIQGRLHRVEVVDAIKVANEVVRIEMTVLGAAAT